MTSPDPSRPEALRRIAAIDAEAYARTRNALDGAVTGLSPWITHGIVTPAEVLAGAIAAHAAAGRRTPIGLQHRLVMELGWREYFRHVWHHRGDAILRSLHEGVLPGAAYADAVPDDVRQARTGVPVIDRAVRELHASGHLHNHARLWLASYLVHLRKVHWRAGADWLWPRLLDGDLASNHLSWQWVAATGSRKPYLFNAENIARHAPPEWHSPGSVLDTDYDSLERIARSPTPVRTRPRPDAEGLPRAGAAGRAAGRHPHPHRRRTARAGARPRGLAGAPVGAGRSARRPAGRHGGGRTAGGRDPPGAALERRALELRDAPAAPARAALRAGAAGAVARAAARRAPGACPRRPASAPGAGGAGDRSAPRAAAVPAHRAALRFLFPVVDPGRARTVAGGSRLFPCLSRSRRP